MDIILVYFSIKYKGDWDAIFAALENKEQVSLKEIKKIEVLIKENKYNYITILDSNYPRKLKAAYKPPFVIWYEGNIELLNEPLLCLSGDQKDKIALERVKQFMPEVNKSHKLVMGYFRGFSDYLLENTNQVVHVCAQGIDTLNKEKLGNDSLFISEYPFNTKPKKEHFGNRNRLISCFADSLVLFNSKKDGGINSIVNAFLNQGKEIYCFPGDGSENDGNSELIKNGANLITSIKDIS